MVLLILLLDGGVVDSGGGNLSAEQAAATEVGNITPAGEVETLADEQTIFRG